MRDINRMSDREMPLPKTGAFQYYEKLGLLGKGRDIKGLVVCNN